MIAITGGKVITMNGPVLDPGTVIVDGGIIVDVISGDTVPDGAQVINARGKYVMPGMIDAHSHIGLLGEPMVWSEVDVNEMTSPITPEVRAIDAFNVDNPAVREIVSGGVTCAYTGPGSANIVGGMGFAFKLRGTTVDEMMIPGTEAMKMALGENPKRVYGTRALPQSPATRLGNAAVLRAALEKTLDYIDRRSRPQESREKFDPSFQALIPVVEGKMKARIHSHRADDILTAVRIGEEFKLDIVIEHATEGYKVASFLAEKNVPCTVGPTLINRSKMELKDINPANPGILANSGVLVAIQVDGSATTRWLPICAGIAMREGMSEEDAFRSVTINPAVILGIDHLVGSLEKGKHADIVMFDGHPLQTLSHCLMTMIEGEIVYSK